MKKVYLTVLCAFSAVVQGWSLPAAAGPTGNAPAASQMPAVPPGTVSGKVCGTVKDSNGELLIGAFIGVKGAKTGVSTNLDGYYEISAPAAGRKYTLVFQYLGMEPKEVLVEKACRLDVVLNPDNQLEEAVIVGAYGTRQRKEDLVGSAFQLNAESLKDKPVTRVDNLLEGMIPGLSIDPNTDDAGSTRTRLQTRIRGEASLSASNEPLWIIDGVVQYTGSATGQMPGMSYTISPLSYIDPSDIESITVLKDADQVAIYGANGANGVILVTTKSGMKNTPLRINATVKFGVATPDYTTMFKMMNAEQYMEVAREAWTNAGNKMSDFPYQDNDLNKYSTTNTFWPREYLGIGNTIYAQIGVRSGTEKTTTMVSGSYYREQNIIKTDNQQRFTLRFKQTANLTKWMKLGVGLDGSYNLNDLFPVSSGSYLYALPIFSPRNDDGTWRLYNKIWDSTKKDWVMKQFYYNYLPDRQYNDNTQRTAVMKATANLDIDIVKGLTFNSTFGFNFNSGHEDMYYARTTLRGMDSGTPVGSSSKKDVSYTSWTNSNILRYGQKFGKFNLEAYVGLELNSQKNLYSYISGSGFMNDRIKELEYAETISQGSYTNSKHTRSMSYFARASVGYDSRYILSGNFRRDGNSIFGDYAKWGTFWSVGGSWNIHKEHFYDVPWLKVLKLKASYGKSGNSRIDITTATGTYSYSDSYSYMGRSGATLGTVPNPDLSWESTYQTNVGIRMEFPHTLSLEVEYYNNYTKDILSKVYVSRTITEDRVYANVGTMSNSGVELTLSADDIKLGELHWGFSFNAAHNRNRILSLSDHRPISFGTTIWMEGYDSNTFMLVRWAGVDPSDGSPMWYDINGNLTKTYSYDNRVPGGSSTPYLFGGLTNNFRWRSFTLSVQFNYTIGGFSHATYANNLMQDGYDIISENQAVEVYKYRWTTPGQAALFPKVSNDSQHTTSYNDRFLYSRTNFKIGNIALSYSLPKKAVSAMRMQGASVSFTCDNVYIFTPGMSREFNSFKTLMAGYPVTRTYSLALNFNF